MGITAVAVSALLSTSPASASEEVNLYSYRQPFLIEPLLKSFTEDTGIKVNVVFAKRACWKKFRLPAQTILPTLF